jgi:hypothetical protein
VDLVAKLSFKDLRSRRYQLVAVYEKNTASGITEWRWWRQFQMKVKLSWGWR